MTGQSPIWALWNSGRSPLTSQVDAALAPIVTSRGPNRQRNLSLRRDWDGCVTEGAMPAGVSATPAAFEMVALGENHQAVIDRHSFRVHVALDGDSGLDALLKATYDAAGVDLLLPG